MKKAAMWTFAILMICTLMTGCGSSASKFAGSYTGAVDMTDVYRQEFEDFTGVSSEASCSVDVTITLTEEQRVVEAFPVEETPEATEAVEASEATESEAEDAPATSPETETEAEPEGEAEVESTPAPSQAA